jgi:hypothetical protein
LATVLVNGFNRGMGNEGQPARGGS